MWIHCGGNVFDEVFIELPDSLWRLRDSSEVRLTKPIILLIGTLPALPEL